MPERFVRCREAKGWFGALVRADNSQRAATWRNDGLEKSRDQEY